MKIIDSTKNGEKLVRILAMGHQIIGCIIRRRPHVRYHLARMLHSFQMLRSRSRNSCSNVVSDWLVCSIIFVTSNPIGVYQACWREREMRKMVSVSWIIFKQKIFNIKYGDRERRTVFKRRRWPFINRFDKFSKRFEKFVICLCCFYSSASLKNLISMRLCEWNNLFFFDGVFFFFLNAWNQPSYFFIYIYIFLDWKYFSQLDDKTLKF